MKKMLRLSLILALGMMMTSRMFSQVLLQENFDYPAGDKLTDHGWKLNSATTGPFLTVNDGGLSYLTYPGSGVGNAAKLVGNGQSATGSNGEDLYLQFTQQTSGTIYVTFMLKVTGLPSASDFFFHVCPSSPSGKYKGRINIKKDLAGTGYQLGICKDTLATTQWDPTSYALNTTYLILLKYVIVTDVAGFDDYAELYVNPALTSTIPTVYNAKSIDLAPDAAIGAVMMRQGGVTYDNIQIDGIRVSTSWTDALPVELNSFTAHAAQKGAMLTWSTATEVNNRGFEIERRAVVVGGSDEWEKVGFVAGAGTSNAAHSYTYADQAAPGKYAYRLKQIDNDGAFKYYGEIEVEVGFVREFKLYGNYPNPFNPSTAIRFTVAQDGKSQVKVFNSLGQEVATVFDEMTSAGTIYEARFDASALPSGLYFARLISNNTTAVVKMMLTK